MTGRSSHAHADRLCLRDARRVFRLVGEVRERRDRPSLQRRRAIEAACDLLDLPQGAGPRLERFGAAQWARLTGGPAGQRTLRWFADWLVRGAAEAGKGEPGAEPEARPDPADLPATGRGRRMLRLLIRELHRLHREGKLGAQGHEPPLTMRQRAIFERMLAGHSAKAIAWELGISLRTVEEHMGGLYERFGVTTRAELMALFIGGAEPPRQGEDGGRRDEQA